MDIQVKKKEDTLIKKQESENEVVIRLGKTNNLMAILNDSVWDSVATFKKVDLEIND